MTTQQNNNIPESTCSTKDSSICPESRDEAIQFSKANNQQQQNIVFIKITQQKMKATQKLPDQTTICSALSILA